MYLYCNKYRSKSVLHWIVLSNRIVVTEMLFKVILVLMGSLSSSYPKLHTNRLQVPSIHQPQSTNIQSNLCWVFCWYHFVSVFFLSFIFCILFFVVIMHPHPLPHTLPHPLFPILTSASYRIQAGHRVSASRAHGFLNFRLVLLFPLGCWILSPSVLLSVCIALGLQCS